MKKTIILLSVIVLFTNKAFSQEVTETTKDSASLSSQLPIEATESPLDTLTRAVSALIDDNLKAKSLKKH